MHCLKDGEKFFGLAVEFLCISKHFSQPSAITLEQSDERQGRHNQRMRFAEHQAQEAQAFLSDLKVFPSISNYPLLI